MTPTLPIARARKYYYYLRDIIVKTTLGNEVMDHIFGFPQSDRVVLEGTTRTGCGICPLTYYLTTEIMLPLIEVNVSTLSTYQGALSPGCVGRLPKDHQQSVTTISR
jgi:hypothetical protein